MVTSKYPLINSYNRVTSSIRPLGSTFKIIPYAAALIEGIKLSDKFKIYQYAGKVIAQKIFLKIIEVQYLWLNHLKVHPILFQY